MVAKRIDRDDGSAYTYDEFCSFYGKERGAEMWRNAAPAGPRHKYRIGMQVKALTKLKGDRNQVVKQGAIGEVTALPGPESNIERGAVAEVLISGVRFDATADMIEPYISERPRQDRDRDYNSRGPARSAPAPRDRPAGKPERRADPNDPKSNKLYTYSEFQEYYGPRANSIWDKAGRSASAPSRDSAPEKRRDPNEPKSKKTYTRAEFIEEYGKTKGAAFWKAAAPASAPVSAAPEKRRDPNEPKSKKTYTKKEFIEEYGEKKGLKVWKSAAPAEAKKDDAPEKRRDPNEPKSKKTYTKKEFIAEYGEKKGLKVWKSAAPAETEEKRRDPNEPKSKKTYTKKEFIAEYGEKKGLKVWKSAAPAEAKKDEKPVKVEDRKVEVTVTKVKDTPIGWAREDVVVIGVDEDSVAAKAGVKAGYKFVSINDTKVNKKNLAGLIADNDELKVTFIEVRVDPTDASKSYFSYSQFVEFYGKTNGAKKWQAAAKKPRKPKADKPKEEGEEEEKEEKKEEEKKEEKKEEEKKADEAKEN